MLPTVATWQAHKIMAAAWHMGARTIQVGHWLVIRRGEKPTSVLVLGVVRPSALPGRMRDG